MQHVYFAHGKNLEDQYYEVGRLNSQHIRASANVNARKRSKVRLERRRLLSAIHSRLYKERIFAEFYKCLSAWSNGAGISIESAIELLDDNTACQTVIARYKNGVVMIHTEEELEDIKARMTTPEIIAFNCNEEKIYSLVYNNLLPGAGTFSWGENYAIAVDSLFLSEDEIGNISKPMLANIASWFLWHQNAAIKDVNSAIKLIKELGNYIDGYALNILSRTGDVTEGYKLLFTRNIVESDVLSTAAGSYLYQLNIIDNSYTLQPKEIVKWQLPYRRFYRGYWNYYKERSRLIKSDLTAYSLYGQRQIKNRKEALNIILHEITGPLAKHYINEVTGAVCVTLVDTNGMSVAVGLVNDLQLNHTEYF